jgi:hypothetical protein
VALEAFVDQLIALVIRGVDQECERHLERLRNLEVVEGELEGGLHEAHDRGDAVARHSGVIIEVPEHLDPVGSEPDLLRRLPEGGVARRFALFGAAARKADLPGVVVKMRRAPREEMSARHRGHHRHEHRAGRIPARCGRVPVTGRHGLERPRRAEARRSRRGKRLDR